MTEGVIFDYGGTLDTGGCHWGQFIWHAYERQQVPVDRQRYRDAYVQTERTLGKNPIIQSNYTFRQTLDVKLRIQLELLGGEAMKWHDRLLDDLYRQVQQATSHSVSVLRQLKASHRMVLVSNFYGNVEVVLHEFGFDSLFEHVVESAVVGVRKPDPRIFTLGVETLAASPAEVTVVGDSIDKDIIPAKRAGCQTVWLRGEGWSETPAETPAEADLVIDNLEELTIKKQ